MEVFRCDGNNRLWGAELLDPGELGEKARQILRKYPLCDRCLGRLFAGLGYGWSNKERGDSLKRIVVMGLHSKIKQGDREALKEFTSIAANIGKQAKGLYEKLTGEKLVEKDCIICGSRLDDFIENTAVKAKGLLKAYDITRYVVGARVERGIEEVERRLREEFNLPYGESIRAELRREIGKRIMNEAQPDFLEPEATVLVHFPSGEIELQVNSLLLRARYWKKARYISQAYWPSPTGPRYYSVEQAAWGLLKATGAERLILHAAGREDIDARMVGSGRPAIIELKTPRRRRLTIKELEEAANLMGKGIVEFRIEGIASRREIRLYKEDYSMTRKIYKALIVVDGDVTIDKLGELSEFFHERLVIQRTPRRVLHRRPDKLRRRRVYSVSCTLITKGVIECIIKAEGGLYIKELVSGDGGRTTPSFSEVLGLPAECVELDVLFVGHGGVEPSTLKPTTAG